MTDGVLPPGSGFAGPLRLQPTVLAVLIGGRLLNAALVQTYFNPDEHWQAPEIAHKAVFGTGFQTWEWREDVRLRGATHPAMLAGMYALVDALGLRHPAVIAAAPRVIHAVLTALADAAVLLLAARMWGSPALEGSRRTRKSAAHVAVWALFAHVCSWFVGYAVPRPLVNSLEAALYAGGLYAWTSASAVLADADSTGRTTIASEQGAAAGARKESRARALLLFGIAGLVAGLSVGVRPTAAVPWAALALFFLATQPLRRSLLFAGPASAAGAALGLAATVCVDWCWFGGPAPPLPLLSFLRANLGARALDAFYGAYPRAWYLYDGIPVTVAALLPPLALGLLSVTRPRAQLGPAFAAAAYVAALSLASHKEHRFLLPLASTVALYAGRGIAAVLAVFPQPWRVRVAVDEVARLCFGAAGAHGRFLADGDDSEEDAAACPVSHGEEKGSAPPAAATAPVAAAPTAGVGTKEPEPSPSAGAAARRRRRTASASPAPRARPDTSASSSAAGSESARSAGISGRTRSSRNLAGRTSHADRSGDEATPAQRALRWLRDLLPASLGRSGALPAFGLAVLLLSSGVLFAFLSLAHQRGAVSAAHALGGVAWDASAVMLPPSVTAAVNAAADAGVAGSAPQCSVQHDAFAAAASRRAALHRVLGVDSSALPAASLMTAHALMQCHSLPWHATVHSPLASLVQLDCSPPLPAGGLLGADGASSAAARAPAVNFSAVVAEHWTEARLWREHPDALLQAMYGAQPALPLACAAAAALAGEAGAAAMATSVAAAADLVGHVTINATARGSLYGSFRALAQTRANQGPDSDAGAAAHIPEGLALHPAVAGAAFAAARAAAGFPEPPAQPCSHRALPTHVVAFDSDAAQPAVAAFLARHGYLVAPPGSLGRSGGADGGGRFHYALVSADAHAGDGAAPSAVLLYEHPCWRAVAAAAERAHGAGASA